MGFLQVLSQVARVIKVHLESQRKGLVPLHMMCVNLTSLCATLVNKTWFTTEYAKVLAGAEYSTKSQTTNQTGNIYGAPVMCRAWCWSCDLG